MRPDHPSGQFGRDPRRPRIAFGKGASPAEAQRRGRQQAASSRETRAMTISPEQVEAWLKAKEDEHVEFKSAETRFDSRESTAYTWSARRKPVGGIRGLLPRRRTANGESDPVNVDWQQGEGGKRKRKGKFKKNISPAPSLCEASCKLLKMSDMRIIPIGQESTKKDIFRFAGRVILSHSRAPRKREWKPRWIPRTS